MIVEDALSVGEIDALTAAIAEIEDGHPLGRNVFEGQRSHRLYSLVARGRPFEDIAQHPVALELLDAMLLPNWLLSNCQSIRLYPGETRQPWHTDDVFYAVPRPHAEPLGLSSIWALDPFTAVNGATELVPGSHRWGHEHPDDRDPRRAGRGGDGTGFGAVVRRRACGTGVVPTTATARGCA